MKRIGSYLITGICCLLIGIIICLVIFISLGSQNPFSKKLINEEKTVNVIVMQEELRDLGFLVTEEYLCTVVEDSEDHLTDYWGNAIWGTGNRVIVSYDVTVSAGVNFEEVEVKFNEHSHKITITIPHSELFETPNIDLESQHVYLEEHGAFSPRNDSDDFNDMLSDISETALERAEERNIYERADNNAVEMITNLVTSSIAGVEDFEDYTVEVKFK